jgi:polyisoprenyl-phosphate glycosyltransferase
MDFSARPANFLLSIVIPCYNEEEVIAATYNRLCEVLGNQEFYLQLIFVNDGSRDRTEAILNEFAAADQRVKVLSFARNFGHQPAVSAGLAHAEGDAVVVIDADLQDPPEVVLEMIECWRSGFDVVYGIRKQRKEALWKRFCYRGFYLIFKQIAAIDAPLDAGDFSLIDRRVALEVNRLSEKNRFFRGLRAWVGFRQTGVPYERQARAGGVTKYPFMALVKLAYDGVFNFSTVPLTIVFVLGLFMAALSLTAAVAILLLRIFDIPLFAPGRFEQVQGFASTILTVLLIGGIQLMSTGILGEYIGRIYQEVKSRPTYIIRRQEPAHLSANSGERDTSNRRNHGFVNAQNIGEH